MPASAAGLDRGHLNHSGAAGVRRGGHAQVRAPDGLAARQPRDHVAHRVRRHREADADVALIAAGRDLGVHADHAPAYVEKGSARVARVDRGVGLDRLLDLEAVGRLDLPAHARDDPGRGGAVEAEGVADGDHLVAHTHALRVGERQGPQVVHAAGVDAQRGQVRGWVGAQHVGLHQPAAVVEAHGGRVGVADHVSVRHDRAVRADDEAGARCGSDLDRHHARAGRVVDPVGRTRGHRTRIRCTRQRARGLVVPEQGETAHGQCQPAPRPGRRSREERGAVDAGARVVGWAPARRCKSWRACRFQRADENGPPSASRSRSTQRLSGRVTSATVRGAASPRDNVVRSASAKQAPDRGHQLLGHLLLL